MSAFTQLEDLLAHSLELVHKGKVRNVYRLDERHLLVVISDRRSVFGFQLGFEVEGQGAILNAFNVANSRVLSQIMYPVVSGDVYRDDLVAFGQYIDPYLPPNLRNNTELQCRAMVVIELVALPVESVVRHVLTGRGYKEYQKTGSVSGRILPFGLYDGALIDGGGIWTPVIETKHGGDSSGSNHTANRKFPDVHHLHRRLSNLFAAFAHDRGVILVESQLKLGNEKKRDRSSPISKELFVGGGRFTPDHSRFFLRKDYENFVKEKTRSLDVYDKEMLRSWGEFIGIRRRNLYLDTDRAYVATLRPPQQTIDLYRERQLQLFKMLHGMTLEEFQKSILQVNL